MGFGFGILRLTPDAFWNMTPRELVAAYRGLTGTGSHALFSRAALDELMTVFPDGGPERTNHE